MTSVAPHTWTNSSLGPKVCFVTDQYPPDNGIIARAAHRLASNLQDVGYDMHIFVSTDTPPSNAVDNLESHPPYIRRVPSDYARLQTAIDFWQERIRFDLFHGFSIPTASACLPSAGRYGRSVIANIGNPMQQSYRDRQACIVLRRSAWIVAGSSGGLGRAHEVVDVASRSSVIAIGLDDFRGAPWSLRFALPGAIGTLKQSCSEPTSTFTLAYTQLDRRLRSQLIPIGDCNRSMLQRDDSCICKSLDPYDATLYTGGITDSEVSAYLKMNVFVMATEGLGLPSGLLKAAALGVPIVATAVDGVKDIFSHRLNCLLVNPWDAGALARAVEEVLRDDILAQHIGEGARRLAESMDVRTEQTGYRKIYARLLDRRY